MTQAEFQNLIDKHSQTLEEMKATAHALHASVNQMYDKVHPYGVHLDMVAESVSQYGHLVCADEQDVLPLFFGAYFHDSIEDARQTYNDVTRLASRWMDKEQAYMAAEIVYALTNDKGRTRAERAGENYYRGIRETPYAPFVKLADRLANITYSCSNGNELNTYMKAVYKQELPHFLEGINAHSEDGRMALPQVMVNQIFAQIS
ncbi:MAG: hypothetical protein IJP75_04450 [Bacteroidaceae bacterium]|nr:hypothetical protein [Bacteroidaceae bacterium]